MIWGVSLVMTVGARPRRSGRKKTAALAGGS